MSRGRRERKLPAPHADLIVRQVAEELQVDISSVGQLVHKWILAAYCPLARGIADPAGRRTLRIRRRISNGI